MKTGIQLFVPFSKVDEEKRMVYGYATTESVDSQGEVVSKDAIRSAWSDYMKFANVREMHQPSAVGVTKEYAHDDIGTWIGVKVVDDTAWNKVKEGVYKGFSIGGRVLEKLENVIQSLVLAEISLVDRPSCPDAVFQVVKMDDSAMSAMITIKKEDKIMNLATIFAKNVTEWSDEEKTFVKENVADLSEDQKVIAKEVIEESVTETPAEVDTPATEDVPETPSEETTTEEVPEETVVENAVVPVMRKDADGVVSLAYLLDSAKWLCEYFASEGKSTKGIEKVKSAIMDAISSEAAEKSETAVDLEKSMETTFKKVLEDSGIAKVATEVAELAKRLEAVEKAPASKRPGNAQMVEKGFETELPNDKTVSKLKEELGEISKSIDAFALQAKDASSSDRSTMLAKSDELLRQYSDKQREINNALIQGRV